ncbi:hypothetical protein IWW55_002773 [Coemansia sp. RSA 2706]|nr:hypothetical protein IWW55_002773 [Coemansia sp. RSA 2706]KAJ2318028.1 hypothetical protein IWW52_002798 [Coemansia sp. RSA 2704]KAJ2366244.1 hypothetical protein H4S01_002814 [Coemansia sp. RSA 2610]
MHSPTSLLSLLESQLRCPSCTRILSRPQQLNPCQHAVCRLCLQQLLCAGSSCPACNRKLADPPAPAASTLERLLTSYYVLRRHPDCRLKRTSSTRSDRTVDTAPGSPADLPPNLSLNLPLDLPPDLPMPTPSLSRQRAAELRASLADGLVDDSSSSETNLDLPEADTFLAASPPPQEIVLAPETPPRETAASEDTEMQTPRSRATYSARAGRKPPPLNVSAQKPGLDAASSSMTAVDNGSAAAETPPARPKRALAAAAAEPAAASPKRQKPTRARPPAGELHILTTGLSDPQTARLRRAAKQLPVPAAIHTTADRLGAAAAGQPPVFTHVVAAAKDARATRTFKYLAGVVAGAHVVSADWLLASAKRGELLPEPQFAIAGDSALPGCALAGCRRVGELLGRHRVHLWDAKHAWDAGAAHSRDDLVRLVRAAGAELVDELPEPAALEPEPRAEAKRGPGLRASMEREVARMPAKYRPMFELPVRQGQIIVLVDSAALKGARSSVVLGAVAAATGGRLPCRTKSWLFDCISANQLL